MCFCLFVCPIWMWVFFFSSCWIFKWTRQGVCASSDLWVSADTLNEIHSGLFTFFFFLAQQLKHFHILTLKRLYSALWLASCALLKRIAEDTICCCYLFQREVKYLFFSLTEKLFQIWINIWNNFRMPSMSDVNLLVSRTFALLSATDMRTWPGDVTGKVIELL